jgi:hypothetical protein
MRVDSATNFTPVTTAQTAGTAKVAPRDADTAAAAAAADTGFSPTGDLSRLLQMVKQIPDVRGEVIMDVLNRASSGDLTSPQAALDTASAVADSNVLRGG